MNGDDELQVKLVVIHIVFAMVIAALVPVFFLGGNVTGYTGSSRPTPGRT